MKTQTEINNIATKIAVMRGIQERKKAIIKLITDFQKEGKVFSPNASLYDALPPSELIVLKEYYDKKWGGGSGNGGCRTQENIDAQKNSKDIEKRLADMAANLC